MEAERPIIVDRQGQHLVWDGSSHEWVAADQTEQSREQYNGMPESMSGEDPSRDTEYGDNPKQDFGTFANVPDHGIEEVPTDNYDDGSFDPTKAIIDKCENCGDELDGDGDCNNCGMSQYDPGGRHFEGPDAQLFPHQGPFSEREPKLNYTMQGDNGTYGKTAEYDWGAPAAAPGAAPVQDFSDPAPPGDGGPDDKHETHRFVIDRTGNVVIEPAHFLHSEIVKKHGLDETGRGSIYRNGTADVHRSWVPINAPELERTLGQHMGQHSIPLNYYPGQQEGMTEGNTAHGLGIGAVSGYLWKGDEYGAPPKGMPQSVPLIYAAQYPEPEDIDKYIGSKGFLTATGGTLAHAVVEGRDRNMGGAVGIGPDYNKVVHGAPVSIRQDGTVEFGQADPDSLVGQYFQRTPEDWQQALDERRQKLQQYPEWVRTRGGSVNFDKSNDELAIEAMTFGPRVAASLDECPECGDVMVDRAGEKVCANCGHVQKIITMEAAQKEAFGLSDIGDAAKGVGEHAVDFAQEHPYMTAAMLAPSLMIPGVGMAAEAGLLGEGAAGAAGAVEGAGMLGNGAKGLNVIKNVVPGMEAAGGEAGVGEQAALPGMEGQAGTAQAPGRVKSLMNGAKSIGKGALINQGINSFLGQGGGGAAGQSQGQDYEGVIASADGRYDMWQYDLKTAYDHSDEADDTHHDNGDCLKCDGDGRDNFGRDCSECGGTGEKRVSHTASEDDPDSLEIGGHSDDGEGSTDRSTMDSQDQTGDAAELLKMLADDGSANAGYDQNQDAALGKFNEHLPIVIDLARDDDHDHSDHPVIQELTQLLEHAFPGDDFGGKHHDDVSDVGHDEHHEKEEAHEADKDFPKASAAHSDGCDCGFCKNMRKNQGVDDDDADDTKEASTHWSVMDMSEADMESIFTGSPSIEFPDERTAAHPLEDGPAMMAKPTNQSPMLTEQDAEQQCPNCATKVVGKFCHECGTPTQSGHLNGGFGPEQNKALDAEYQTPENSPLHTKNRFPEASVKESAPPITPTRTVPGPDSAVDKGKPINDVSGNRLAEGQMYMMKSKNYEVPDEVKILKLKPNSVSPTHVEVEVKHQMPNGEHFSFPNEISIEDITNDGLSFEPIAQASPEQVQEAQQGVQPDEAPDAGEVTDLSGPTTEAPSSTAAFEGEGEFVDGLNEPAAEPVDGLVYTGPSGEPVGYEQYAASLRSSAPPHLAWLWDNVEKEVEVSERQQEFARITAGKDFTHMEQREFINEPGEARNKDKLDLSDTHYLDDDMSGDDELWFN